MRLSRALFSSGKKSGFYIAKDKINPCVLNAQYAVRGEVPTKAMEIEEQIKAGTKFPFDHLTECNIGNPQHFHQPPISYNRRVLACLLNPELLNSKEIHQDVKKRAKKYLD